MSGRSMYDTLSEGKIKIIKLLYILIYSEYFEHDLHF